MILNKKMLIPVGIFVFVLVLGLTVIDSNHSWGDDFAAYMTEGIAIANGSFDEQVKRNVLMHPTARTEAAKTGELVYAWGFPLMLSVIYRLFGFNTDDYSIIIYFKIPGAICLALLGAVLYLFYKRRFSNVTSVILSMVICFSNSLLNSVNRISSDIPGMMFCYLSLLLMEVLRSTKESRHKLIMSIFVGVGLWFTCTVRLNGITIYMIFVLYQFLTIQQPLSIKNAIIATIPHLVFWSLTILGNTILSAATSNASDIGQVNASMIIEAMVYSYHFWKRNSPSSNRSDFQVHRHAPRRPVTAARLITE